MSKVHSEMASWMGRLPDALCGNGALSPFPTFAKASSPEWLFLPERALSRTTECARAWVLEVIPYCHHEKSGMGRDIPAV